MGDLGLVEWIAGIGATAPGERAAAERHHENALRHAEAYPHRVEQPEVRRWYARMLLDRNPRRPQAGARAAFRGPDSLRADRHAEAQMADQMLKDAS